MTIQSRKRPALAQAGAHAFVMSGEEMFIARFFNHSQVGYHPRPTNSGALILPEPLTDIRDVLTKPPPLQVTLRATGA